MTPESRPLAKYIINFAIFANFVEFATSLVPFSSAHSLESKLPSSPNSRYSSNSPCHFTGTLPLSSNLPFLPNSLTHWCYQNWRNFVKCATSLLRAFLDIFRVSFTFQLPWCGKLVYLASTSWYVWELLQICQLLRDKLAFYFKREWEHVYLPFVVLLCICSNLLCKKTATRKCGKWRIDQGHLVISAVCANTLFPQRLTSLFS